MNYKVEFFYSKETAEVSFDVLYHNVLDFLGFLSDKRFVGEAFHSVIGDGNGEERFQRLLMRTGYDGDPQGFFKEIVRVIEKANCYEDEPVVIGGLQMPDMFMVSVLESIMPSKKFVSINSVAQLEKWNNIVVPEEKRSDLQHVLELFPVRLSMHTLRQMRFSRNVAYQYLPFVEELDRVGHVNTWIGQFHQGLLEQMYRNRVIFLLNMSCPVYCRFCFRKHKESRNEKSPTPEDVRKAVSYINYSPSVKEIVITGGDPFLNPSNVKAAVDGLKEINHVQTLRLATRSVSYYPHLFYDNDAFWLKYLKTKSGELSMLDKRMELATHFIHPDEISPESLEIISELVKSGVAVYIQTPFLKDCNDKGPELVNLYGQLRGAGAEMHYIYIPCSPIHGNSVYWAPISNGLDVGVYLRGHLSDRAIPRICTATPIGKIDWHTSGWAVEQDADNSHFIWIRTPYTPSYFKDFAPVANELDVIRVNEEGTIDAKFMAQIGDESLFRGSRTPTTQPPQKTDVKRLKEMRYVVEGNQKIPQSIVDSGIQNLYRIHKTRVEMDVHAGRDALDYIARDENITDVILSSEKDAIETLNDIERIVVQLREIHHVNAVRLRSFAFNYTPERYSIGVLDKLTHLNKLSVVQPLRLEIETQFIHSDELRPEHGKLSKTLQKKGITVYNNTPLLININANPDEIHKLSYLCRENAIEFHHLYVCGLPIQEQVNEGQPVDIDTVIDIATKVRREGSGREIPRYILRTILGDVDFGLSSRFIKDKKSIWVKLLPYSLEYYQHIDPNYAFPKVVKTDRNGRPMIHVPELKSDSGFMTTSH